MSTVLFELYGTSLELGVDFEITGEGTMEGERLSYPIKWLSPKGLALAKEISEQKEAGRSNGEIEIRGSDNKLYKG